MHDGSANPHSLGRASMKLTIRSRLLLLMLAVLIPAMLAAAGWLLGDLQAPRQGNEIAVRDSARALPQVALGALALLSVGVAASLWLAHRLAAAMMSLKAAARRMQSGQPIEVEPTGVIECDEVGEALVSSAKVMAQGRTALEGAAADAVARTRDAAEQVSHSQRLATLGRLTGGVAHDFNNLLGIISNSAHLIERHPASGDLAAALSAVRRALEAGAEQTRDLLRIAGHQPVGPQPVDLSRFLPELYDLMSRVVSKRIQITIEVAPSTAPLHVDPGELELALLHLVLQSQDAMPTGGELRVVARNANLMDADDLVQGVGVGVASHMVLITVSDDGAGIAPERVAKAFEPFSSRQPVGQATALGLSHVHSFCAHAGGRARLDSTPGVGTAVTLLLPSFDASSYLNTGRSP